jgi:hypothetical protein
MNIPEYIKCRNCRHWEPLIEKNKDMEEHILDFGLCHSISESIKNSTFFEHPKDNIGKASYEFHDATVGTGGDFFCKHFTLKTEEANEYKI